MCSHNRLPFVQRLTAFYQVLHILSRKLLTARERYAKRL